MKKPKTTPQLITGRVFSGTVVSDRMAGTIVVSLDYTSRHPRYQKIIKKRKKLYAENNLSAAVGDIVRLKECAPLSKLKRFTTVDIVKKAS